MEFHYTKTVGNMTCNRAKDVLANTNRMIFDYEELVTNNGSYIYQSWSARVYKGKYKFIKCACLPFKNEKWYLPKFLTGKATSVIGICNKPLN